MYRFIGQLTAENEARVARADRAARAEGISLSKRVAEPARVTESDLI
jgi:hypothetical protein